MEVKNVDIGVIKMEELPRYYLRLFNAVTDALALIDEMNFGTAKNVLIEGQCWAEKLYVESLKGELTSEDEIRIWLESARMAAEVEKNLAEQEEDERIDAAIRAAKEAKKEKTGS